MPFEKVDNVTLQITYGDAIVRRAVLSQKVKKCIPPTIL